MNILWDGEKDICPYCTSNLHESGVWTDEAIRKSLSPGQVYLAFSGDDDLPYVFVKIICIEGDSLTVKIFKDLFTERPQHYEPGQMVSGSMITRFPVDVLLAWGPPEFPVLAGYERVSEEELDPRNWDGRS